MNAFVHRKFRNILVIKEHLPLMICVATRQHFEEASLAGPIGAGKTYNLCLSYLQRYTFEDASPAQIERDVSAGQQCHSLRCLLHPGLRHEVCLVAALRRDGCVLATLHLVEVMDDAL